MRKSILILSLIGIYLILLTISVPIFANDYSLTTGKTDKNLGVILNDPNLTPEIIEILKQEALMKDKKMEERQKDYVSIQGDPDGGEYYSVSVTNYKQETTYWCGPASVRQSLSWHKTSSGSSVELPSQSAIAQLAGTISSGSTTTGLRTAINNYAKTYRFEDNQYVVGNVLDTSNPPYIFETRIKGDLRYRTNAPIILVDTVHLSYYEGKSVRHYVTVSGYIYDKNTGEKELCLVDPHYDGKYRGYHWEPMENVFNSVKKADTDGTNYVMLY